MKGANSINKCPNCIKTPIYRCEKCQANTKKLCQSKYDYCLRENHKRECDTQNCSQYIGCLCYEIHHKIPILSASESEKSEPQYLEDYDKGFEDNYD